MLPRFCAFSFCCVFSKTPSNFTENVRGSVCFVPFHFFCLPVRIALCWLLLLFCIMFLSGFAPYCYASASTWISITLFLWHPFDFPFLRAIAVNKHCLRKKMKHSNHSYTQYIAEMSPNEKINHDWVKWQWETIL